MHIGTLRSGYLIFRQDAHNIRTRLYLKDISGRVKNGRKQKTSDDKNSDRSALACNSFWLVFFYCYSIINLRKKLLPERSMYLMFLTAVARSTFAVSWFGHHNLIRNICYELAADTRYIYLCMCANCYV